MHVDADSEARGGRLYIAADAFLFSAAFDITATMLLLGIPALVGADLAKFGESMGSNIGSLLSIVVTAIVVFAGAAFAWRMHGRRIDRRTLVGMVLGVLVGGPIAMAVFIAGATAMRRIRIPGPQEGPPWLAIGVLGALTLAFLAVPIIDAIRDMSDRRAHLRLDRWRIVGLLLTVACSAALPFMGGPENAELGEAAIFMVPFAAAGALAVVGADILKQLGRARERAV